MTSYDIDGKSISAPFSLELTKSVDEALKEANGILT